MSKKELLEISRREWNEDIGIFDSLIIIPTNRVHDSGYTTMDFIAVKDNLPIKRLSGCSDVLHLNGIGGYGQWSGSIPTSRPVYSWNIDCLKKSKLLHIWCIGKRFKVGEALSSFELFIVE
jgi:hypothetical protein